MMDVKIAVQLALVQGDAQEIVLVVDNHAVQAVLPVLTSVVVRAVIIVMPDVVVVVVLAVAIKPTQEVYHPQNKIIKKIREDTYIK